jgi:acetyl-CoA C-acetyltransferase
VSGARTAIGAFGGALKSTLAVALGAAVMRATLERSNVRPVMSEQMKSCLPNKLKDQGSIEIEQSAKIWNVSATPVPI